MDTKLIDALKDRIGSTKVLTDDNTLRARAHD